jgi:tripartite-type tricarboxylate transporter receptor subunit TctC
LPVSEQQHAAFKETKLQNFTAANWLRAFARAGVLSLSFMMADSAVAESATAAYPSKPVRIMVGYGPGGTGDLTMRLVAQKMAEKLGQQFIIENRPGAGGIIASQAVKQSAPDGYTLNFIAAGNFAMTPSLFRSLPFDPVRDFETVSLIGTFGFALAVDANSTIKDTRDLIARAKADPGKITIGTVSIGSAQFLSAEVFKSMAGIDVTIVPYKTSADVVRAVRAGDVHAVFETIAPIIPHLRAGAVRVLGVTEEQRFPALPDVPTIAESALPNYVIAGWNGLAVPAGTPRNIILKLNAAVNAAVAQPDIRQKFNDLGVTAKSNTPEQMSALLKKDIAWWREVIEKAKIEKQ